MFLFDWLAFTVKNWDPFDVIELLGMQHVTFIKMPGARGYTDRLYYDKISIHYGDREEVWCEMSGQGCRAFESYGHGNWSQLFDDVRSGPEFHITRLDIAYDDHEGLFDLCRMADMVRNKQVVSWFTRHKVVSDFDYARDTEAISIYHGSPSSEIMFRIYDKAAEREREDEGHWVRFEMQLRRERAKCFIDRLLLQPIGEVFVGVVNEYLRYVVPDESYTNKRRWPSADFWDKFIGVAGKIKLYEKPGVEYNFSKLEMYVIHQAGSAFATYLELVGVNYCLEECNRRFLETQNPKYIELIRSIKSERREGAVGFALNEYFVKCDPCLARS